MNKDFFRSIAITLGRQGLSAVVQFLNVLVIAKFLGPEGNGIYSMALIISLTLGLFLNLGMGQSNAYFVGRREFSVSQVYSSATKIFWLYLLILAIVFFLLAGWFESLWGLSYGYLCVLIVCVPVIVLNSWLLGVFQGREDFSTYNAAMVVSPVISLSLTLILVALGIDEGVFFYGGWFLGNLLSTIYLVVKIKDVARYENKKIQAPYLRKAIVYGWKAHLSNLSSYAMYRVDIYFLNYFYGSSVVGVYSVAQQIIERFWMIAQAVSTVLFPRLASLNYAKSNKSRVELTCFSAKWVFLSSILCGFLVYFLVDYFIEVAFGNEYSMAALAVQILLPGMIFFNLSRVLASYSSSTGFVGYMAVVSLICLMVSVAINLLLTPIYGISGAALATTISYITSFGLGFFVFKKISR